MKQSRSDFGFYISLPFVLFSELFSIASIVISGNQVNVNHEYLISRYIDKE